MNKSEKKMRQGRRSFVRGKIVSITTKEFMV